MITFPPLVLVSDNLFIFELLDYFARYIRPSDDRITCRYRVAIGQKNNIAECNFVSGGRLEFLDRNSLSRAHPILLASRTNNRVRHAQSPVWKGAETATANWQ